jgi:hypothetical protein
MLRYSNLRINLRSRQIRSVFLRLPNECAQFRFTYLANLHGYISQTHKHAQCFSLTRHICMQEVNMFEKVSFCVRTKYSQFYSAYSANAHSFIYWQIHRDSFVYSVKSGKFDFYTASATQKKN